MPDKISHMTALVLCGGKGTRLQGLHPGTPKPLIPVSGRPFVEWLSRYLAKQGWRDFVFAAGHLAEVVEAWIESKPIASTSMVFSRELEPLGTGGGLLLGLDKCGEEVLALNGDSMLLFDLQPMADKLAHADMVIAGVYNADCSRFGTLDFDEGDGHLRAFREKQPGAGFINGGIYVFRKSLMDRFPRNTPLSMETDIMPALLASGAKVVVHSVRDAPFLDIGLPQTLGQAEGFIDAHKIWF